IEDVKADMQSTQPMDRLLCGDVGYGKTEVAMRAAFKAASDNKQVVVLAPTTVLAFQHFETFKKRFSAFPLTIEMLSRFRSPKQQKEILEKVEAGKVDILIGIQTVVANFDEKLIRSAIEHELEREGQAYFVHNRVESIYEIAAKIQELVPKARVIVGHGQMSESELEKVMLKFIRHEADVL